MYKITILGEYTLQNDSSRPFLSNIYRLAQSLCGLLKLVLTPSCFIKYSTIDLYENNKYDILLTQRIATIMYGSIHHVIKIFYIHVPISSSFFAIFVSSKFESTTFLIPDRIKQYKMCDDANFLFER